eukprot:238573-Pyramimonas_sp.AAC.1
MLIDNYRQEFGDPFTNGKNHAVFLHCGYECARVPGQLEWSESNVDVQGTRLEEERFSSDRQLFSGEVER